MLSAPPGHPCLLLLLSVKPEGHWPWSRPDPFFDAAPTLWMVWFSVVYCIVVWFGIGLWDQCGFLYGKLLGILWHRLETSFDSCSTFERSTLKAKFKALNRTTRLTRMVLCEYSVQAIPNRCNLESGSWYYLSTVILWRPLYAEQKNISKPKSSSCFSEQPSALVMKT